MVFDKNILPLILFQFLPEMTILAALSLLLSGYKIKLEKTNNNWHLWSSFGICSQIHFNCCQY